MATKTDPRESLHGEEEERPLFGPGSGREDVPAGDPSDPSLYDPQSTPLMDSSDPRAPASPKELAEGEAAGGVGSTGKTDKKESSAADKLGKGFSPIDAALPPQAKLAKALTKVFKTRKGQAGLATGGIVGGLIFIASIGQGPFMLMQLGQLLLKPEFGNEKSSSIHFMQMMRYAKTGDFGETRVGYLRSKLKDKYIAEFNKAGVDFEQTSLGRPSKIIIDTNNPSFSKWKNLNNQEFLSKLGLPTENVDEVTARRNGSELSVEFDTNKSKGIEFAGKAVQATAKEVGLGNSASGRIGSNLRFRTVLVPYFGLPGLLSPISKKQAELSERAVSLAEARKAEADRASPRTEKIKELSASARSNLKDKLGGIRGTTAAVTLGAAGGACIINGAAEDAAEFNYQAIVKASAIEAVDKMAIGSQVQAGVDTEGDTLRAKSVGNVQRTLIDDDGKSVFGAKGIDALARNNKSPKGEDIPVEYSQAFSQTTTADNIKKNTEKEVAGVDVTDLVCGWPGQVAGGAFSLALLLAGPPSGGAAWALLMGKTATGVAAGFAAGYMLTKLVETDLEVKAPLAGALGGNLMAYGSRASANMNAISSGGIELSDEESIALLKEQETLETEEFRSKSFFARMFDLYDYRSLASVSLRSYSPDLTQNLSTFSSNMLSGPSELASSLMPKAFAQEEDYNWYGQKMFGLPREVQEDPRLQDPDQNDLEMSNLLNSSAGQSYVDKAKKCFGVDILKEDKGWGVKTVDEVNPKSSEYTGANCNNIDDLNWRRTMLFVFQSKDLVALACYEGVDDEACEDLYPSGGSGESAGGDVGIDGDFAFPIKATKSDYGSNYPSALTKPTCENSGGGSACHHDYFAADIGKGSSGEGAVVVAAKAGTVRQITDPGNCNGTFPRLHIEGEDGKWYYYAHLKPGSIKPKVGDQVSIGEELAEVGADACAQNTPAHLHFDVTKKSCENSYFGRPGGEANTCLIDPMPAIRGAYEKLPS